ncbi:MAG: YkgJ family cysteine cluster protein [Flavobacteriales bacterium]
MKEQYKKLFQQLKKKNHREVDRLFHDAHEEVFACTDCLKCANCCKTTGPLFTDKDIERISKHLRLTQQQFIEKYLRVDEDKDYVLQKVPCTFLDAQNYCSIYDVRPKACREYPHTDRVSQQQLFSLTAKNISVCPAVEKIMEKIKKEM